MNQLDTSSPLGDTVLALTLDDAPSVAERADPERMDRIRESLQRLGIEHCVAFVIGAHAEGEDLRLQRWLNAGYELGNHTFTHPHCSELEPAAVLEEVRRCDEVLDSVGAFAEGRPRYFRFPFLDRGPRGHREEMHRGIEELGYRVAHASVDWFDYRYEDSLHKALETGDEDESLAVEDRFIEAALRTTRFEAARGQSMLSRPVTQIAYGHFGEIAARCLPNLVLSLERAGVRFCGLEEALQDPIYGEFDREPLPNGRVLPALARRGIRQRMQRLLSIWSAGLGFFRQGKRGPLWPYYE